MKTTIIIITPSEHVKHRAKTEHENVFLIVMTYTITLDHHKSHVDIYTINYFTKNLIKCNKALGVKLMRCFNYRRVNKVFVFH